MATLFLEKYIDSVRPTESQPLSSRFIHCRTPERPGFIINKDSSSSFSVIFPFVLTDNPSIILLLREDPFYTQSLSVLAYEFKVYEIVSGGQDLYSHLIDLLSI